MGILTDSLKPGFNENYQIMKEFSNSINVQDFGWKLINYIFYDNSSELIKLKGKGFSVNYYIETVLTDIDC